MPTATLTPPAARGSDFAGLSQLIVAAGLMRRRPGYYLARIGLVEIGRASCRERV